MPIPVRRAVAFVVSYVGIALPGMAEDWPMWRGPQGDGTSLETNVPVSWGATENVAWKVELPGEGHASPIVWQDRVFLALCLPEKQERVLLCLDRKSGKTIWQRSVLRAALEKKHPLNSYASSTPATDGKQIYVSFLEPDGSEVSAEVIRARAGNLLADNRGKPVSPGHMVVAAFDMQGRRKWLVRPGEFASVWGYCSCPVPFRDKVIVNGDHDGDAYIVALDRSTGNTIWKVARENRIRSHCTPIIRHIDGRTQMFVSGGHSIVSYDPSDGSQHWFTDGPTGRAVASLVYNGELLLVTAGYPRRRMLAIRPDGHGDVTDTHVAWEATKSCPYVPSPIAAGNHFLMVADNGIASCWDASTGQLHWRERIGRRYSASLVSAAGLVYFLSDDGIMKVVRPGEHFELVAQNELGEPCYASPAISSGQIFLRGEKHLYCIGTGG